MTTPKRVPLKTIYEILQKQGLTAVDYKHLPYSELCRLAGVKQ